MWGAVADRGGEGGGAGKTRPSPTESARLLRQRLEMGDRDLFLGSLTREEALALVGAARRERPAEPDVAHDPSGPSASATPPTTPSPTDSPRSVKSSSAARAVPPPRAPAGSAGSEGPVAERAPLPDDYEALRTLALGCTACRLADGRTQVVFSDGPAHARVMVVGEAPGANEDATGVPFVGAAGKYLDLLLRTVDLSREESVYICNVLKCRPPGNRNPMPDEIASCAPFLKKQIDLVRPEALLAVGSFAGQLLTGREKTALGKMRGEVHAYHGVPLIVTYHPAALLRNAKWTRAFWSDLQLLRTILDEA